MEQRALSDIQHSVQSILAVARSRPAASRAPTACREKVAREGRVTRVQPLPAGRATTAEGRQKCHTAPRRPQARLAAARGAAEWRGAARQAAARRASVAAWVPQAAVLREPAQRAAKAAQQRAAAARPRLSLHHAPQEERQSAQGRAVWSAQASDAPHRRIRRDASPRLRRCLRAMRSASATPRRGCCREPLWKGRRAAPAPACAAPRRRARSCSVSPIRSAATVTRARGGATREPMRSRHTLAVAANAAYRQVVHAQRSLVARMRGALRLGRIDAWRARCRRLRRAPHFQRRQRDAQRKRRLGRWRRLLADVHPWRRIVPRDHGAAEGARHTGGGDEDGALAQVRHAARARTVPARDIAHICHSTGVANLAAVGPIGRSRRGPRRRGRRRAAPRWRRRLWLRGRRHDDLRS